MEFYLLRLSSAYKAGRLIEATSYSGADNLSGKTEYSYDERGRLIEESYYDSDGEGIRQKSLSYNAAGKRAEDFLFYASPGDVYEIEGATYNAAGASLIESIYDADDKLIEVVFYDDNRSPVFRTIMTYDADGNLVEDAQYTGDAFLNGQTPELIGSLPIDIALFKRTHTYDAEKKKIGESIYFTNSLKSKRVFLYDANGIKTEESEYGADGLLRNRVRFLYEYNSFGDWTKEAVLKWSAGNNKFEPHLVTYRTFTYY